MKFFRKVKNTIRSIYLCIRFPFLYPRNRFTGFHYNNWKIMEYKSHLWGKAYRLGTKENGFKNICISRKWALLHTLVEWYHDKFLQFMHCIPTTNELDMGMDVGWKKAFGIQMCKEIKQALLDSGGRRALYDYRITQIKEKFGELCWYDSWCTDEVWKVKAKYEYISSMTCIHCGNPADGLTRGYILPYCSKCHDIKDMDLFYTERLPFYGHIKHNTNKNDSGKDSEQEQQ